MLHDKLVKLLLPFVEDEGEANELGWVLICASFGYRQIFDTLGLDGLADFSVNKFGQKLAYYLAR